MSSTTSVDVAAIPRRVAAGAEWLDRERPGWWKRIDLDRLDLGEECRCILGQLYGNYFDVPIQLDQAIALGFDAQRMCADGWDDNEDWVQAIEDDFAALTAEWRRVIEARRAQAGAHDQ